MEQKDLLIGIEEDVYMERASVGARFVNALVDSIGHRIIIYFISPVVVLFNKLLLGDNLYQRDVWAIYFAAYLFGITFSFFYYTILEGSTKGRTLGKLVTGTSAIMNDGTQLTWRAAALRSLCRMIPFEPLSAFSGNPWHDSITKTQVVKIGR